jgi:hypothetical protein
MKTKQGLVIICLMSLVLLIVQSAFAENIEPQNTGEECYQDGNLEQTMESTMEQSGENYMYNWRHRYRTNIQQGIDNKSVTMECNLSKKAGKMYVNTYEYEKGMSVEVKEQSQNKLQIKVSAEFKEGKVLVLNIDGSALKIKNSQQLKVKFDGNEMAETNVDEIIHGNGTEAKFAAAIGEDGGQYLVYIPHFSEHIISFEIVGLASSQSVNFMVGAVGIAILTVVLLMLIIIKIGKFKKEE